MKHGVITVRQQLTERPCDNSKCPTCQENHKGLRFATPKTESGEYRKIEIDGVVAGVLLGHQLAQSAEREEWGSAYSDHDLVFCCENGKPLSPGWVSDHFHRLTDAVMVPADPEKPLGDKVQLRRVRLHGLSHGQATLMLAAGVDMNVISKRLGHARSSFTAATYAHMLDGVGREAAEKQRHWSPAAADRKRLKLPFSEPMIAVFDQESKQENPEPLCGSGFPVGGRYWIRTSEGVAS